jgi:hypothetical protein
MTARKAFFDVFRMVGKGFEPVRTVSIDGETIHPGTPVAGDKKVGGLELRRLTGGGFDVREKDDGKVLVLERGHTRI